MRLLHALILALCLTLCAPARAADNAKLQPILCNPVGDIISSAVFDADAACGNSYKGSGQVLENLQQYHSPAETNVESSCPLVRGGFDFVAGSTDPTFVGHPGKRGSYWHLDGTQFFRLQNTDNPFVDAWGNWPNFNKPFTFVVAYRYVDNGAKQAIFSTSLTNRGVTLYTDTDNRVYFEQDGDLGTFTLAANTTHLVSGNDYIIGVAHSGTTVAIWVASTTAQTGTQTFKNSEFKPDGTLSVGTLIDGASLPLANGTRIYDIQMFNAKLTDMEFASDVSLLHTRDGIGFSP